ncbi:hypothetical protein EZS27_030521 [termite gut metagenome]|uniref:Uncharacterized protein n=1 Tax=termite gut metagenome TaxID=433724 RepID=A0A5J4QD34_9ZZZZ
MGTSFFIQVKSNCLFFVDFKCPWFHYLVQFFVKQEQLIGRQYESNCPAGCHERQNAWGSQKSFRLITFGPPPLSGKPNYGIFSESFFATPSASILCYIQHRRPSLNGSGNNRFISEPFANQFHFIIRRHRCKQEFYPWNRVANLVRLSPHPARACFDWCLSRLKRKLRPSFGQE